MSARLKELVDADLVSRKLKENRRVTYSITEKGKKLVEKIKEMEELEKE